jgi:D-apionate oxidoisomerase
MTTVALIGAGGKIGFRIAKKLYDSEFRSLYLEISPQGIAALAGLGVQVTPQDIALPQADVVILAVPDNQIARLATE